MNMMPANAEPRDEGGFNYNEEERYDHRRGELFWDFKINLLGVKDDTPIHFCDKCRLPIKIYGRMIPCKHAFCYGCTILHENEAVQTCPGCNGPVLRIERYMWGSLFMCNIVQGCKRTYLSQRDLKAHIRHRHLRTATSVNPTLNKNVHLPGPPPAEMLLDNHQVSHIPPEQYIRMPPLPLIHVPKNHYNLEHTGTPVEELSIPLPLPSSHWVGQKFFQHSTRKRNNLITVPIRDDSNSGAEPPLPVPGLAYHRTEYQGQLAISHPPEIIPPWLHYGPGPPPLPSPPPPPFLLLPPPAPPALPVNHPMQYPSEATGTSPFVYSQAPPPPAIPVLPPFPPPLGNAAHMLPNVNRLPLGPPPPLQYNDLPVNVPGPHHNYPDSWPKFTADQGTLNPPYTQPGGMRSGMWSELRELSPLQPPTPLMQGPPQGLHQAYQTRYHPYYQ